MRKGEIDGTAETPCVGTTGAACCCNCRCKSNRIRDWHRQSRIGSLCLQLPQEVFLVGDTLHIEFFVVFGFEHRLSGCSNCRIVLQEAFLRSGQILFRGVNLLLHRRHLGLSFGLLQSGEQCLPLLFVLWLQSPPMMLGSSGSSRLLLPSIDPGAHSGGWLAAHLSLSGFSTPVLASQSDEHAAEILHVAHCTDGGRLPRITCSQPSGTQPSGTSTLIYPFLIVTERLRTNKSVTLLSRVSKDRLEPKWLERVPEAAATTFKM